MNLNPLIQTDGYKVDHRSQYPKGTSLVYSNFTPRSTAHAPKVEGCDNKIILFGLQYFIKWYLIEGWFRNFFSRPVDEVVAKYKRRIENYLGPDAITYEHIEQLHELGYLPIAIHALPEGSAVDERVPVLTIENTLPDFFWLTNFLETVLSCMLWKPSTSATTARKYRQLLNMWCKRTGGDPEFVKFQAHDFSFRGLSCIQEAQMSGAAHLLSFVGTDTIPAIDFLEDYYGADSDKELIGCSVPATEHSVMCMGSKKGEFETFKRLITETYPAGIVSIVSDTWDFWQVVTDFLPRLKDEIMSRNGKVVIRPDSGDPVKIICGDPDAPPDSPAYKGAIACLWDTFGGTETETGHRQLDDHIGLIYGDSITLDRCSEICRLLDLLKFASTNVVLGIGSFTYAYVTRDTYGWAMKATAGAINGEEIEIFKDPKTDSGMKKSAKGFLAVNKGRIIDELSQDQAKYITELEPVFVDGELVREHTLQEIRERITV
jgi:nicotinamide phosphoribosyltransferase